MPIVDIFKDFLFGFMGFDHPLSKLFRINKKNSLGNSPLPKREFPSRTTNQEFQ